MEERFGPNPWPQSSSIATQYDSSLPPTIPSGLSPDVADVATKPLRRERTWPALLTLYILAPIVGEVLSGSTPPLNFLNPFVFLYQMGLYGSGAIIVRELVRRRGLGWGSILMLGAAYGILEEGLVITSWFNPYWPDLGHLATYGRLFDTSWVWALELTMYHAVVSISIPIVLVEMLFPRLAERPWLGRKGFRVFCVWLAVISLFGLFLFGFVFSSKLGYTHPPIAYFIAVALAVACVWLGLHLRLSRPLVPSPKAPPRLWSLRLQAFAVTVFFFFTAWALPNIVPFPIVPILLMVSLIALGIWRLRAWASRSAWGPRHRLALASGVLGFFILLSPILELFVLPHTPGKIPTGVMLFALTFLVGLIVLAWRVRRKRRQGVSEL